MSNFPYLRIAWSHFPVPFLYILVKGCYSDPQRAKKTRVYCSLAFLFRAAEGAVSGVRKGDQDGPIFYRVGTCGLVLLAYLSGH